MRKENTMMKKITILTAAALCAVSLGIGAAAAGIIETVQSQLRPDFTVVIDGETKTFKNVNGETVYPMLYNGTTYLPIRAIGEIMGKTVYWYEQDKRIELKDESTTVTDADVIVPDNGNNGGDQKPAQGNGSAGLTPNADEITLEKAKSIAFEKAGVKEADIVLKKARLEMDDGIRKYDIEFNDVRTDSKSIEYSAEIRASDGALLDWDVDEKYYAGGKGNSANNANNGNNTNNSNNTNNANNTNNGNNSNNANSANNSGAATEITADQAKAIALQKAGLSEADVTGMKVETDMEHGVKEYEVEFRQGKTEYSAEINAADGSIIKWETDND